MGAVLLWIHNLFGTYQLTLMAFLPVTSGEQTEPLHRFNRYQHFFRLISVSDTLRVCIHLKKGRPNILPPQAGCIEPFPNH